MEVFQTLFFFCMIDDGESKLLQAAYRFKWANIAFRFHSVNNDCVCFFSGSLAHRIEVAAVMHSNEFWGHVLSETNLYELLHLMCSSFICISTAWLRGWLRMKQKNLVYKS